MLHLYVNYPEQFPCYHTISEALSSLPDAATQLRSFPAPQEPDIPPVTIHIAPGIYEEPLVIERPYVTLVGEQADTTILTGHLGAFEPMPDGSRRGTFRTASVRVHAHDFTARCLTFQNSAGYGHTVGQALALYADGDRLILDSCRLISSQDTLFTAPLPPTAAKPGGFTGPGEHTPRFHNRQFYVNCYIQGDVDFIFGGATAYFQNCTVYSKKPGDRTPPESPSDQVIYGYATAASTPRERSFGYVFQGCRFESDCPPTLSIWGVRGGNGQKPSCSPAIWAATFTRQDGWTGTSPMITFITVSTAAPETAHSQTGGLPFLTSSLRRRRHGIPLRRFSASRTAGIPFRCFPASRAAESAFTAFREPGDLERFRCFPASRTAESPFTASASRATGNAFAASASRTSGIPFHGFGEPGGWNPSFITCPSPFRRGQQSTAILPSG